MRLISRYLLGQLAAPFTYALAATTGIMVLDQVAKKFGALVGKGLDWQVIGEVFLLSLPFIVAMTLPMAVLVAVLYAFSHLAADQEITAMRASGLSVGQLLAPVLVAGVVVAAVNFAFVDQILPRSNTRLRNLWLDIGRKKPTFELREQVVNPLPPSRYFLRASRIDAGSGRMKNVTIYDMGLVQKRRIVYADSGRMAFTPNQQDISLLLWHGTVQEYDAKDPGLLQLTSFVTNDIRVRGVANDLERSAEDVVRGDREMSSCEMLQVTHEAERDRRQSEASRDYLRRKDAALLLGLPVPKVPGPVDVRRVGGYCRWWDRTENLVLPARLQAQAPPPADTAFVVVDSAPATAPQAPPVPTATVGPVLSSWAEIGAAHTLIRDADRRAASYMVEVHKKWSISSACITFVLVGIALALRFPRGGIGLVIGGSLFIFCLYYVALTGGESLADREFVSPAVAMWSPNILLLVFGLWGLVVVNREGGSTRGGDLGELADLLRFHRRFRRAAPTA